MSVASKQLINSLKSELSKQSSASKQTRDLQKQLESRNEEVAQLRQQLEEMKSGLNKAQTEAKSLQTKLTAARNAAANAEKVATARGSGVRPGAVTRDTANGLLESAQVAQLKEDLYSDLTGLIIRDVKKRESDHLYDCIQTGLNGSMLAHVSPSIAFLCLRSNLRSSTSFQTWCQPQYGQPVNCQPGGSGVPLYSLAG